jgi:LL-diaminopimelate aminotransferase
MPLLEENDFKPDIETIDPSGVKMMFLNYPNNPTGATVDKSFLKRIVEFAQENSVIVCYDNPYSEITFDNYDAPSILEIPGGKNVAVEFNSCSKTFNMTGDRIAFATGNEKLIRGLAKVKAQVDSGPSVYIQKVAVRALESYNDKDQPDFLKKNLQIYASRRDLLVEQLRKLGFACTKPKATFYLWIKCNSSSMEFTKRLLDKGVAVTPGIGFGEHGKNFVRFSLTQPIEKIAEACRRMNTIFT